MFNKDGPNQINNSVWITIEGSKPKDLDYDIRRQSIAAKSDTRLHSRRRSTGTNKLIKIRYLEV